MESQSRLAWTPPGVMSASLAASRVAAPKNKVGQATPLSESFLGTRAHTNEGGVTTLLHEVLHPHGQSNVFKWVFQESLFGVQLRKSERGHRKLLHNAPCAAHMKCVELFLVVENFHRHAHIRDGVTDQLRAQIPSHHHAHGGSGLLTPSVEIHTILQVFNR